MADICMMTETGVRNPLFHDSGVIRDDIVGGMADLFGTPPGGTAYPSGIKALGRINADYRHVAMGKRTAGVPGGSSQRQHQLVAPYHHTLVHDLTIVPAANLQGIPIVCVKAAFTHPRVDRVWTGQLPQDVVVNLVESLHGGHNRPRPCVQAAAQYHRELDQCLREMMS